MQWQFYWRKWHLGFDSCADKEHDVVENYLFLGPVQLRWPGGSRNVLFWHKTGPLLYVKDRNTLHIEDLNPQQETRWVLTRWEMVRTGLRLARAGLRAQRDPLKLP